MLFVGLGERDVEGSEVCDWPGDRDGARGAGDGAADELAVVLVFGGCTASSTPLLTSSLMVSIAELFPSGSTTPSWFR